MITHDTIAQSVTGRHWQLARHNEREALAIAQRCGVPPIVGQLLSARGIGLETAHGFLNPRLKEQMPDPFHLRDMAQACERLARAIIQQEVIAIWGDYDVDGATSTALLLRYFQQLGISPRHYIPDRMREGYGPNTAGLLKLQDQGAQVIITVDCGITAYAPLAAAAEAGLDVVVIDHHIGEAQLPQAVAVVNPNRLDETSDYGYLAAVGVVFLLLVALNKTLEAQGYFTKQRPKPNLLQFLDIVALGTVCDVVPLVGLNRALVAQGLRIMANREHLGLKILADSAKIEEMPNAYHLGFLLGPRINAGGRVGKAELGTLLLSATNPVEAETITKQLEHFNTERKALETLVLEEAINQIESRPASNIICAIGHGWHQGVIGIVAGRLKERYHLPSCVISMENGIGKGSGRSINGIHLGNLILAARQSGLLEAGGGHAMAAGFTVREDTLPAFMDFMAQRIETMITTQQIVPRLRLDAALPLPSLSPDLASTIEQVGPFGASNPKPIFYIEKAIVRNLKPVGENHLRFTITAPDSGRPLSVPAIAFRAGDSPIGTLLYAKQDHAIRLAVTIKRDTWGGYEKTQCIIEDAAE